MIWSNSFGLNLSAAPLECVATMVELQYYQLLALPFCYAASNARLSCIVIVHADVLPTV